MTGKNIFRVSTSALVLAAAFQFVSESAHALVIKASFDKSITSQANAAAIKADFNAVADIYESALGGNATINVNVSWGTIGRQTLPAYAVGASITAMWGFYSYAQVGGYLADASARDPLNLPLASLVANLPATDPTGLDQFYIPSGQAKLFGIDTPNDPLSDGAVGFAGNASSFTFGTGPIQPGTYDFRGVVAHELSEVLGHTSGVIARTWYATPFDLTRWSAPGVPSFKYGDASAYLSVDGGQTSLGSFNATRNGDQGDLKPVPGVLNVQNYIISKGQRLNITAGDLTALDALGYGGDNIGNSNSADPRSIAFSLGAVFAPEPASLGALSAGLALLGLGRRTAGGSRRERLAH